MRLKSQGFFGFPRGPNMSVKPARKLAIVRRQQRVADLYLQGRQKQVIAAEQGIPQPMVSEGPG
jgi:hypothetical protein